MSNDYIATLPQLNAGETAKSADVNERYSNVISAFDRLPTPKTGEKGFAAPVPVGAPVNPDHAVTKLWAETGMTSQLTLAQTAASTAQTAASTAESYRDVTFTYRNETLGFRDQASSASSQASVFAADASGHATTASGAATTATARRDEAVVARTAAEAARDAAVAASNTAVAAETGATAAFNDFDQRYLGAKASAPTTDNQGGPLDIGMLYFDTTAGQMRAFDGLAWNAAFADFTGLNLDQVLAEGNTSALGISVGAGVFSGNISAPNLAIANWNTAFSWGNHAAAGYASAASALTAADGATLGTAQSFSADKRFADNISVEWGTDGDFEAHWDGSAMVIRTFTHGALTWIQAENSSGTNMNHIRYGNGVVDLYHNNALRLTTTVNGVAVSGSVTATNFVGNLTGLASNSSQLNGLASSSAANANTIVARDASADINVRLLRSNFGDEATLTGAIAFRVNNSTDNYNRYCNSPASVRTWMDVPSRAGANASGTWPISITGNSAKVTSHAKYYYENGAVTPVRDGFQTHIFQNWSVAATINLNSATFLLGDVVEFVNVQGAAVMTVNATTIYLPDGSNTATLTLSSAGKFRLIKYAGTAGLWMFG